MEIEENIDEDKGIEMMDSKEEDNSKTDGEVNIIGELVCVISEIKKLRKKIMKQKEKIQKNMKKRITIQNPKCQTALKK